MSEYDLLDARLAATQDALRSLGSDLTDIRGDLAALRHTAGAVQRPAPPAQAPPAQAPPAQAPPAQAPPARSALRDSGFTGNTCDQCGGARMVRSGTCELCRDCGTTTGCS